MRAGDHGPQEEAWRGYPRRGFPPFSALHRQCRRRCTCKDLCLIVQSSFCPSTTAGPKETEDFSGQMSPAHTHSHTCPAPHWLGHGHRTSPPLSTPSLFSDASVTSCNTNHTAFFITSKSAAPFSNNPVFGVTLFYTTIFCRAFSFQSTDVLLWTTVCACVIELGETLPTFYRVIRTQEPPHFTAFCC